MGYPLTGVTVPEVFKCSQRRHLQG